MGLNIKWIGAHPNNYLKGRSGRKVDRIVLHWIVGTLESADSTFNNPTRYASSTYGVGGKDIHQYVKEYNAPYTNGVWDINMRSITIEHEGSPSMPISAATYESSAQLIADICKRYGWTVDYALRKPRHRDYSATQCPGTLDVARIKKRVKQIMTPEYERNNKIIKIREYVATAPINLISFLNGKTIKSYAKGTRFQIKSETTYKGKKYYRTTYSTDKKVWNGLLASSLEVYVPPKPPEPEPVPTPVPVPDPDIEPEPVNDDIVGRLTALEKIVDIIVGVFSAFWGYLGSALRKIKEIRGKND